MPTIDIPDRDAAVLRRFAALQFPGSVENMGTRSPVHFLQHWHDDGGRPIPVEDYGPGDKLIYGPDGYEPKEYKTPEDLVLGITGDRPAVPFDPKKKDLAQWLTEDCAVDPDDIQVLEPSGYWEDFGVSLVRQDMLRLRDDLSNHVFGKTRVWSACPEAFGREIGDLGPAMALMLRTGTELLREEADSFLARRRRTDIVPWSHAAVRRKYRDHPDEPFIGFQAVFTEADKPGMVLTATCEGRDDPAFRDGLCAKHPVLGLEIIGNGPIRRCGWPFEDDPCLDGIGRTAPRFKGDLLEPMARILSYVKYSLPLD